MGVVKQNALNNCQAHPEAQLEILVTPRYMYPNKVTWSGKSSGIQVIVRLEARARKVGM